MYVIKAAKTAFVQKIRTFNVDEIDYSTRNENELYLKQELRCITCQLFWVEHRRFSQRFLVPIIFFKILLRGKI